MVVFFFAIHYFSFHDVFVFIYSCGTSVTHPVIYSSCKLLSITMELTMSIIFQLLKVLKSRKNRVYWDGLAVFLAFNAGHCRYYLESEWWTRPHYYVFFLKLSLIGQRVFNYKFFYFLLVYYNFCIILFSFIICIIFHS